MNTDEVHPQCTPSGGLGYYEGPDIVDRLLHALVEAQLDPDALDIDDLAGLDEFHALGRGATVALADLADVQPEDRVLDIGAGIGGPARYLAARRRARVIALDATPRFCRAAELLTRGAGLADRVTVVCGDARTLPFKDASFDLAWSQAVSQNVADKQRLIAEAARVVRPGGRVALFEVVAGPGGPVELPVPWADEDEQSWLVSAEELRELLEAASLQIITWNEGQAALDAIAKATAQVPITRTDPHLGLHILMPDFEERMAGLGRNIAQDKIALVQVVARRSRTSTSRSARALAA
jgi:ubiquinone/menaquinone biosynthesis C-methylase UbiE